MYGRFMRNVNEINSYAWGEAALVEINHSLDQFKKAFISKFAKENKVGLRGCAFTIMEFVFEYARLLHKLFNVTKLPAPFLLACGWAKKLSKMLKDEVIEKEKDQDKNVEKQDNREAAVIDNMSGSIEQQEKEDIEQ
ncbi:hypothetical protein JCGZ_06842 [Jatropha curcas]|uniref:Aminotransferase-like plant mobile domain-containing protein n=1 Tax=Jatropha curcas TaxID=180498 RepID=A0A067KNC0_JATCU|nr:hypothetical protein JCGZ_06842 [Jatropha curcas]